MKKQLSEIDIQKKYLENKVKEASDYFDRELACAEKIMSMPILAEAMGRWISATEELRKFNYLQDREKYFINGVINQPSSDQIIYINWDEDDGI